MTLDAGEIVNRDRYPIEDLSRARLDHAYYSPNKRCNAYLGNGDPKPGMVGSMYRVRDLYGKVSDVHATTDSARVRADQLLD